jgi:hypothetical protein
MKHNLLPVVLGKLVRRFEILQFFFYVHVAGGADYSQLLPAQSYINMRDYPNLRQLGQLNKVSRMNE